MTDEAYKLDQEEAKIAWDNAHPDYEDDEDNEEEDNEE
jgi:hypothetical protein